MTRFNALVLAVHAVLMTLFAIGLGREAEQWISTGYGLNPLIALPLATLCIVSIFVVWFWLSAPSKVGTGHGHGQSVDPTVMPTTF